MGARWSLCGIAVAVAIVVFVLPGQSIGRATSLASGCKSNYDYAGLQNVHPAAGIRAYLSNIGQADVQAGHVAGWMGVGGPGMGPNKTDEWLQIGYAGFPAGEPGQI